MAVLGLLAVPLMVFASPGDGNDLTITYWGRFGSATISSSTFASVSVGTGNTVQDDNSLTVGSSLKTEAANSLVVGTWNKEVSNALFVVGNGTGSGFEANVIEILNDGSICIPEAQGDIDMGDFGN